MICTDVRLAAHLRHAHPSMVSLKYASLGAIMAIRNTSSALPLEHVCVEGRR